MLDEMKFRSPPGYFHLELPLMLVYIGIPYFCDWKPGRFRTTSFRRKSNKFRYEIQ